MTKCNPDVITQFALHLAQINNITDKGFNAAMRREFPGITNYALRKARQDARIMLAIRTVMHKLQKEED